MRFELADVRIAVDDQDESPAFVARVLLVGHTLFLIPESRSSGVLINGLDFGSWLEVAERMVGCASLAAADPRSWAAGSLYLCMPHYKRYRLTQSLAQSYWPAYGAVFPH